MALIYRIEKKKIIRSQLHLVNWIKHILVEVENCQDAEKFRQLILQDTEEESKKRVVGGDKFE